MIPARQPPEGPPQLSVILPAFNEEALLGPCVRTLRRSLDALAASAEIVIVDDGSVDGTAAIADGLARELSGVVVIHQSNQGIGGAFLAGVRRAAGDYVMLWPADMDGAPEELAPYTEKLGAADVIVGVRRQRVGYNPLMRLNAWIYPRLVAAMFALDVPDVNWIHAYDRKKFAAVRLAQRGIPMLVEALVRLRDAGATFALVDVRMVARTHGTPSAARFRVMVRTIKGLFAFWWQWRQTRPRAE